VAVTTPTVAALAEALAVMVAVVVAVATAVAAAVGGLTPGVVVAADHTMREPINWLLRQHAPGRVK
jgi:hypothetical protein